MATQLEEFVRQSIDEPQRPGEQAFEGLAEDG
jgi:hypothetical protein